MSIHPLGVPLIDIGRDVNGQFRPGNKGGPGNPFARKVAALRKALLDSVSEQDLAKIIEVLKKQAIDGDLAAIKLILQYCVGKPESPKDPDRMDIDEWDRLKKLSVPEAAFEKTTDTMPACVACHLAATRWPCNLQDGPLADKIEPIVSAVRAGRQPPTGASPTPPVEPTREPPPTPPSPPDRTTSADRRSEPTSGARRESRSPTQPPSPNGRTDREQLRTIEQLRRAFQPAGQTENHPSG